jgi:hypothetical protein
MVSSVHRDGARSSLQLISMHGRNCYKTIQSGFDTSTTKPLPRCYNEAILRVLRPHKQETERTSKGKVALCIQSVLTSTFITTFASCMWLMTVCPKSHNRVLCLQCSTPRPCLLSPVNESLGGRQSPFQINRRTEAA